MIPKWEKLKNKIQLTLSCVDTRIMWLAKHKFKNTIVFIYFCLCICHKREV